MGKFALNQTFINFIAKPKPAYMALASRTTLILYRVEPNVNLI
jgi:hypothetical protein